MSIGSNTSLAKSMLNAGLIPAAKKKFKIPADIKLSQVKTYLFNNVLIRSLMNIYLTMCIFRKKLNQQISKKLTGLNQIHLLFLLLLLLNFNLNLLNNLKVSKQFET